MNDAAVTLVQRYFDAFNARDTETCLSLLAEDVVHDTDGGAPETGKRAFRDFLERTNRCYEEMVVDLFVTTSDDGRQATAEFTLLGVYLETDDGLPEAEGQRFSRPSGAVFEIRHGKVARVSEVPAPDSDSRH